MGVGPVFTAGGKVQKSAGLMSQHDNRAWQSCAMVRRWWIFGDFLGPAFSASRVQHVSDLHLKSALRPHHVWKYGRHPICDGRD